MKILLNYLFLNLVFIRYLHKAPRQLFPLAPQKDYVGTSGYMEISVKQRLANYCNGIVSTPEVNDLKGNGMMITNNVIRVTFLNIFL
jgi:hypothetical protein